MTSADPREVCNGCFEHFCRLGILAVGESSCPRAQGGRHLARRQSSLFDEAVQPADASLYPLRIADCRFGKAGMEVGESEAGTRKMPSRMCGDLVPFLLGRRGYAIKPPAPQER